MGDMKNPSSNDFIGSRKGLLISPELCIACRGCQTACKEWNNLPAERTKNRGSHENPPDLSQNLYNKIRFVEVAGNKGFEWLFISQRCMHCGDAGCLSVCPAPGAITRNELGAVVFNKEKCTACKLCRAACPFDIPRFDEDGRISKCHLCQDRTENGLLPACAKGCPTGAIRYGDRVDLMERATKAGYKTLYGSTDLAGMGAMYAFKELPEYYGFDSSPSIPASVALWKSILKPLVVIGLGASVVAAAAHYVTSGPKVNEKNKVNEKTEEEGDK